MRCPVTSHKNISQIRVYVHVFLFWDALRRVRWGVYNYSMAKTPKKKTTRKRKTPAAKALPKDGLDWEYLKFREVIDPEEEVSLVRPPAGFWKHNKVLPEIVASGLGQRKRKFEIKHCLRKYVEKHYQFKGNMKYQEFEDIYDRARLLIASRTKDISADDHMAAGVATLQEIIRDIESSPSDRIKAQQELNEMLGTKFKYGERGNREAEVIIRIQRLLSDEMPREDGTPPE